MATHEKKEPRREGESSGRAGYPPDPGEAYEPEPAPPDEAFSEPGHRKLHRDHPGSAGTAETASGQGSTLSLT